MQQFPLTLHRTLKSKVKRLCTSNVVDVGQISNLTTQFKTQINQRHVEYSANPQMTNKPTYTHPQKGPNRYNIPTYTKPQKGLNVLV